MGDCHYLEGNHKAQARGEATSLVLEDLGIDPERYVVAWVSSAEAPQFAEIVRNFVGQIRELGPNPCRPAQASAA